MLVAIHPENKKMLSFFASLTLLISAAHSDSIKLNFYPSPYGINWKSPGRLARSVILNRLAKGGRKIGHVSIELTCGTERYFSGMVESDNNTPYTDLLFKEKYGFGVLYYDFNGYMETDRDLTGELAEREAKGNLSFFEVVISPETCQRLVQYHREYQQLGFDKHYGLINRPRYREGAGCSAYGASMLDVAGVLDPEWKKAWNKTIQVPEKYIGGPTTGRRVSFLKIALLFAHDRWARDFEPHRTLSVWDPDEMHRWVKTQWKLEKESHSGHYELLIRGKAKGLRVDRTWVPTPNDSFWKN